MKKTINSKHSRSVFIFALLSLFMCMSSGKVSAVQLKPVVQIENASYTRSGTEVTLKLWIFNWKLEVLNSKQYNSRFTGDVYLCIDDKEVVNLKEMWSLISDANFTMFHDIPGYVSDNFDINHNGTKVGYAHLRDLKIGQTCPYNPYGSEKSWVTIDLKLSFKKTFSYYGHKFTVKGKWQDQTSGSLVEKDVALKQYTDGYVRPINFKVQPSGDKMMFTWEQQGYTKNASTEGKWIVFKREGNKKVKLNELAATEHSLNMRKTYTCSKDYIITFVPKVCEWVEKDTISGLTAKIPAQGHKLNNDDICQVCGHSFFRYQTSDGNIVNIPSYSFGANLVSHKVINGECVIEFEAPITTIPASAFYRSNITGNLIIPNSVKSISEGAFCGCPNLNGTLTLPNSLIWIYKTAFSGCTGFTGDLVIPESVRGIEMYAFSECTGFTGDLLLPKSLEKVGYGSFENCNNIQTVNFQSLPQGIGNQPKKKVSLNDDSYISKKANGKLDAISYTRTMTSNWGTLVLPYSLTLTGDEPYRLYSIDNMTGEELVLKQLDGEVAAGTPCVVKRKGSEAELTFSANNAELNMAINDRPMDGMNFSGTYWTKDVTNGYIIAKDCFWNVEKLKGVGSVTAVKVGPFRAWLDSTSANAPAQLSMRIDGSTTGINVAEAFDALNDAEAEYYDLSGKRLDEPQKGVNIVRMKSGKTKKIIIK